MGHSTHLVTDDPINAFVLQEFRLRDADAAGEVARIVAAFPGGIEPAVPLLQSIDDERNVATVRALHIGETAEGDPRRRAALDPLVASWQPLKKYGPRITERSERSPSHYRLAVTESGINNVAADRFEAIPRGLADVGTSTRLDLLWTGVPVGMYAGMLILLGDDDDRHTVRPDPHDWPLPLSSDLGVRIYESRV